MGGSRRPASLQASSMGWDHEDLTWFRPIGDETKHRTYVHCVTGYAGESSRFSMIQQRPHHPNNGLRRHLDALDWNSPNLLDETPRRAVFRWYRLLLDQISPGGYARNALSSRTQNGRRESSAFKHAHAMVITDETGLNLRR